MHALDAQDAATVRRAALECQAIAADLERLKTLIADAGDRLLASFNVVGDVAPQATHNEQARQTLAGAIATAVTALQFQDMATQLTSHAQGRLGILREELGRFCEGSEPLLSGHRPQPVAQAGMGAGSIDLFRHDSRQVFRNGATPMQSILAVDDSASMRQMVAFTLKGAGYNVIEAADGQEALEKVRAQHVDLVLTDQNMPRMDGITLVKNLRALQSFAGTPMLILTTESSDEMKQKGKAAGATGWLVKPFDPAKLLDVIKRVIR